MATKPVVGLDIGGTKVLAAVYDARNELQGRFKLKTRDAEGDMDFFARVRETVDGALADAGLTKKGIAGIGVGCPGPLDPFAGVILEPPNLPLRDFPLKRRLEKQFNVPVLVDNDVNVGTYGEYCYGAGRGYQHVVGIFLGTGVGGGLVLDGRLFRGGTGGAGEIGHMVIDSSGPVCGCGQRGCLEAFTSRLSLARDAATAAFRGGAPTILAEAGTDLAKIRSKALRRAYKAGDPAVVALIERAADALGRGMASVANLLNPQVFVLGGGLIDALADPIVAVAEASMRDHAMTSITDGIMVAPAALGDYAVPIGGAAMIRDFIKDE
jgi:glucokinase